MGCAMVGLMAVGVVSLVQYAINNGHHYSTKVGVSKEAAFV